jgi:aspartyl protease family protein
MSASGPWGAPKGKPSRTGLYLWLGVVTVAGLLILLLSRYFPTGDSLLGDPYMVRLVGMLALISTGLLFIREINLKQTIRNILIWTAVGGVLVIGFSFQNELRDLGLRLRSDLVPGYPVQTGAHEMALSEGDGGSFHVYGTVNDTRIRFLIDTGATDIVLDPQDALRLGINLDSLTFDRPFGSANGIGYGASLEVANLSVGAIHFSNVKVSINRAPMGSSLLGMAFLKRLKSYSVSGNKLILRW